MGHLYHGELLVITRGYIKWHQIVGIKQMRSGGLIHVHWMREHQACFLGQKMSHWISLSQAWEHQMKEFGTTKYIRRPSAGFVPCHIGCQSQWCPLFNGCDPSVNGKNTSSGKRTSIWIWIIYCNNSKSNILGVNKLGWPSQLDNWHRYFGLGITILAHNPWSPSREFFCPAATSRRLHALLVRCHHPWQNPQGKGVIPELNEGESRRKIQTLW